MNPTSDHVDIAGYLVEMLTPEQKQRADAHLATCADCRTEIESLQQWSSALDGVPAEMLLDGPPDDADLLLQRTLRQVRTESAHRRQQRATVVVAAAAAVIVAAILGGVLIGRGITPSSTPVARPTASVVAGTRTGTAADPATGARIEASIIPAAGWVRVSATVGGIPAGEKCRLEVVGRDGTAVLAGSWLVSATGEATGTTLTGSALLDPAQVASVRVVNTTGRQFVGVAV
ncbi:anti-sigma factor family protein [Micromonosporaceae bacterium Da 78-11]